MNMSVPPIRAAGLAAAVFFITAAAAATAPVQAGAGGPGTALMAQTGAGMALNPDHPERYVVKRGDTLWDISAMFLRDPWYWPEIWYVNPQVANPHLIYPGDVLTLVYVDGRPQIRLDRGTQAGGTERLSPRIREEDLDDAITTIPFETIGPFLSKGAVLSKDEIDQLPYVVAIRDKHLVASAGNDLYVRGNVGSIDSGYSVVHIGEKLVDPETNDVLGYEGIFVGEGTILRTGDPATLRLNKSTREALTGDRLIVQDFEIPLQFYPRAPDRPVQGQIMHVVDGVTQIGQYQVVILNRGAAQGLDVGHVLTIWQQGETVKDRFARRFINEKVTLPDEQAGTVMVFKTYDRMSYALVMEATSEIHVLDAVRNPS
jgi:hypothetical protein